MRASIQPRWIPHPAFILRPGGNPFEFRIAAESDPMLVRVGGLNRRERRDQKPP